MRRDLCRDGKAAPRKPRHPIFSPRTVAQSRMTVIVAVKAKYKAMFAQGFIGPRPNSVEVHFEKEMLYLLDGFQSLSPLIDRLLESRR
jgi:hypothetical protein